MRSNYIFAIFIALQSNSPMGLFSQSADKNYILTRTMLNEDGSSYLDAIQYYDGLGRPSQLVQKGITSAGADLVTMQEYDAAGRAYRQWIPAPFSNNGNYVDNFANESSSKHGGDNYPYAEIQYDNSPLNRVLKKTDAGSLWHTRGKGVSTRYLTNTSSGILGVTNYSVDVSGSLSDKGTYAAGELYCTETTDENGNVSYVFIDKLGQTVLIRQLNGTEVHDTYYVYDDFGNPVYVLPPMINGNISADNLNKYGYRYKYDERNRCIEVKLPGCEPIYQIYDKSDRLVLKQDGNQRARGVWLVNKYDKLGRLLYTSEVKVATELSELRRDFSGWLVTESFSTGAQEHPMEDTGYSRGFYHVAPTTLLTVYYYDTYDFLELLPEEVTYLNFNTYWGKNSKWWHNAKGLLTGKRTYALGGWGNYTVTAYYYDSHGNVIQKLSTNHLGGYDNHYYSYSFSGKLLKDVHEHSKTMISCLDICTNTYDHAGRLVSTAYDILNKDLIVDYSYDDVGRMKQKRINNVETIKYDYNIRNWMTDIISPNFTEKIDYININKYYNGNISRIDWKVGNEDITRNYFFGYDNLNRLTSADYTYCTSSLCVNPNFFDVKIESYDKQGNILQLSRYGRITSPEAPRIQPRIVNGDEHPPVDHYGVIDNLSYTYNGNQLKSVSDVSDNDPVYKDVMHFVDGSDEETEYTYDANGNMTSDKNKGIDDIIYNSLNLPNTIWMEKSSLWTFVPGVIGPGVIGPGIVGPGVAGPASRSALQPINPGWIIPLNYERPFIEEFYWADGRRYSTWYSLERSSNGLLSALLQSKVDYSDNFIYENDSLSKVLIPDGYLDCKPRHPVAYFYLKDHQGNNRLVINESGAIEQVNHYYPFGGLFGESSRGDVQAYKYNGKELDRMHGLDWYDYGARLQDPVLGRFISIDPMCEKYYSISPYTYCNNNPIKYIDPNGMFFSTDVKLNEDGTYEVVGGEADGDLNIYLTIHGQRTGDIIGRSLTEYSFLDDNGRAVEGAIINPADKSGINFISNDIIKRNPNILSYMPNATGGGKYDFKRIEEPERLSDKDKLKYYYRGMPFNDSGTYASARDIGNWGAGYVAGKSGLSWGMARLGFDALESAQNIFNKETWQWYVEGQPTQQAERSGYQAGQLMFNLRLLDMLTKFIK